MAPISYLAPAPIFQTTNANSLLLGSVRDTLFNSKHPLQPDSEHEASVKYSRLTLARRAA